MFSCGREKTSSHRADSVMAGLVPAISIISKSRARPLDMPATSAGMTTLYCVIAGLDPAIHAAAPNIRHIFSLSPMGRGLG